MSNIYILNLITQFTVYNVLVKTYFPFLDSRIVCNVVLQHIHLENKCYVLFNPYSTNSDYSCAGCPTHFLLNATINTLFFYIKQAHFHMTLAMQNAMHDTTRHFTLHVSTCSWSVSFGCSEIYD